jgi:5'-deoxynucleotidase YfbR-like HD superfamily hydrolase
MPCVTTPSGFLADIENLAPHLSLRDIAKSLSKQCRFNGNLPGEEFYSVAKHSVALASYFITKGDIGGAQIALLHDACEAYIGDVSTPIKAVLPGFRALEALVESQIMRHYLPAGFASEEAEASFCEKRADVAVADKQICQAEAAFLYRGIQTPAWVDPKAAQMFDCVYGVISNVQSNSFWEECLLSCFLSLNIADRPVTVN